MKAVNLSEQSAYIIEGTSLKLSGDMTVQSIGKLFKKNPSALQADIQEVDCKLITSADSSFLALLLFLQRSNQTTLQIHDLPEDLKSLMRLYDLDGLLNLTPAS